jgi:hypothetical protein
MEEDRNRFIWGAASLRERSLYFGPAHETGLKRMCHDPLHAGYV